MVTISAVKFFNYKKTPERGVKNLEMYIDGIIIRF